MKKSLFFFAISLSLATNIVYATGTEETEIFGYPHTCVKRSAKEGGGYVACYYKKRWAYITNDDKQSVYFDIKSFKKDSVWIMLNDFKNEKTAILHIKFNCKDQTAALAASSSYHGLFFSGSRINSYSYPENELEPIPPGSLIEFLTDQMCAIK